VKVQLRSVHEEVNEANGGLLPLPSPTENSQTNVAHWDSPAVVNTSFVCQKLPVVGSMDVDE
jgi:hypothetical protein